MENNNQNDLSNGKVIISYGKVIGESATIKSAIIGGITGAIVGASIFIIMFYIFNSGYINFNKEKVVKENNTNKEYRIENISNPAVAVAEKLGPAIVGVKVTSSAMPNIFGIPEEQTGEGSGIIFREDGYIVTNYHVIEQAYKDKESKIEVTLTNEKEVLTATIVGGDKITDLAVIKVDRTGLTSAKFGDSSLLKVGDTAIAIGNPLGQEFEGSVTSGVISALNRKITTDGKTFNLIQTDAAINPGNSGGALANINGEVIGINSIKIGASGIEGLGFAIPINDAKPIIDELVANKKIVRPYIGIYGKDIGAEIASRYKLVEGIYVSQIIEFSPAEKSGIKPSDVIVKADGKSIKTMEELNDIKNSKKIGDKIKLTINRSGKEINITVTLEENKN